MFRKPINAPFRFERLEPRLLLSADPITASVALLAPDAPTDTLFTGELPPFALKNTEAANDALSLNVDDVSTIFEELPSDVRSVLFVDGSISDYQTLLDGIDGAVDIVVLDAERDGIAQISAYLAVADDVDSIHIASHGNGSGFWLGNTFLNQETLTARQDEFAAWADELTENADILIYGCDLASTIDGQNLINELANLTEADIAASDDLTGNASLNGDWQLEFTTGKIDSSIVISATAQANWQQTLGQITLTTGTDQLDGDADTSSLAALALDPGADGLISLREAIKAANANLDADIIFFGSDTYTLTQTGLTDDDGDFDIRTSISFVGEGPNDTTILGNNSIRLFEIHDDTDITVTFSDLKIEDGRTTSSDGRDGAGIKINSLTNTATVHLDNVWFLDNQTDLSGGGGRGGAIYNEGILTITNALLEGSVSRFAGGAIYNAAGATLDLVNVTISGGSTTNSGGAGISNDGTATIINSTITNNSASGDGGGIKNAGALTIGNTIVAGNTAGFNGPDIYQSVDNSLGGNIIGDDSGTGGFGGSDQTDVDPLLGLLMDNGGALKTHALGGGSTALNAAETSFGPETDQRGYLRDATPDIGAFESAASANPASATLWFSTNTAVSGGGQQGTDTWDVADINSFADPNLNLGPGTTNGSVATEINFAGGAPAFEGLHFVSQDVTLAGGAFQLLAGDVLFNAKSAAATFISNNVVALAAGFSASVNSDRGDIVVFRPDTVGDFSAGQFGFLFDDIGGAGVNLHAFTLAESDTNVGGTPITAGEILFVRNSVTADKNDIWVFNASTLGDGATTGTSTLLLEGGDAGVGISTDIHGLELIENTINIGNQTFSSGEILVSLKQAGTVGSNNIAVTENDIFVLDVTQSTESAGAGNGSASAEIFFTGADVAFDSSAEIFNSLALHVSESNDAPTLTSFAAPIDTTNEETEVEITFAELAAQGDEADTDGTVNAFVVQAVSSGTLLIGATSGTATAFAAGTNDVIGVGLNAYWTPANNQNGTLNAFTVEAKDDDGALSGIPVTAQISVANVNDAPVISGGPVALGSTDENTTSAGYSITTILAGVTTNDADGDTLGIAIKDIDGLADWQFSSDSTDGTDGTWQSIPAVNPNAALLLSNTAWVRYVPDGVNAENVFIAFTLWDMTSGTASTTGSPQFGDTTPGGGQTAFSTSSAQANVTVTDDNDAPTLTAFAGVIDTTNEDTEVEITFAELAAQGNEADVDGTVDSFVVQAVSTGTLRIGATAGTATAFAAGTNDVIGVGLNAYWTPANNQNGTLNAFTVEAKDDDGAESGTPITAQINVTDVNDAPTLTTFAAPIDTTNEDIEVEITFAELAAQGNEADVDGTVDSFVVQAVSTGTLRIGATAGTATAFAAGTNDVIGVGLNAYWTPANNQNGTLNAFTVEAKDDDGAESGTPITAQINVTDVNDLPTLTTFAAPIDTTNEDIEVEITFAELAAQGNEADVDGTVDSFVVQAVSTGTLRIGATAGTATAFAAGTNDVIGVGLNAYWTPANNQNGTLNAFTVEAKDDDGAESGTPITAQINVTDVNDAPTLTTFAASIDTTNEDTEVEITFAELAAQGNEADVDGTVDSFVVQAVSTGTLRIGANAGSATAFVAGTNDVIGAGLNAYWTPANNQNGTLNALTVEAKDDDGAESGTPITAQINVTDVNDAPTLTAFAAPIDTTNEDIEVEITFAELAAQGNEADVDGTVDSFVVQTVSTGTLRIGATAGTATAFAAGTNDVIGVGLNAYWTPANNQNGTLNAFTVEAKDDDGAESGTPITAQISVTDVNDLPTLTTFAAPIDTTNEDTEVEITFAELAAQGNEADVDGTVDSFVVQAVSTGTLRIGATAGTATAFAAGTNDVIGVGLNAYWTPANNQNGTLNAFTVEAKDDDGAESGTPITAQISVTDVNDLPTLTTFAAPIDTTNEDIEVEITFAELAAQGNEADVDGTVDSFVVQAVSTGTLRIGATAGTATAFAAGTNDVIGVGLNAYWTPANNQNGTLNAFTVEAKDDDGAESGTPITAQINVTDVNDAPTLTTFAAPIDTTNEDIEVEITFAELAAQGNEADVDGTVDSFVVQAVSTGTLRIGATAGTATAFAAGTNDVIGVGLNAYWTPANNQNGTLNAFTVEAKDDDGAESGTPITAQINVTDVNDAPTLTTFAASIDTTNEDTEVEITFAELAAQGNEADVDGTVDSFVVQAVSTGTLRIGATAGTATTFAAGTNDVIGVGLNAYWTPANNQNGTINAFTVQAKDNDGAESGTPVTAQISVTDVNDIPTFTNLSANVVAANTAVEEPITFANINAVSNAADVDGTITSYVVQSVLDGSLRIGTSAATATPWAAGTNDIIDGSNVAFWTSSAGASGSVAAFDVVAKDDDNAESLNIIQVVNSVFAVNLAPTLDQNTLTIAESESKIITALDLSASDVDDPVTSIKLSISNVANGQFERVTAPGVSITNFAQTDITSGAIRFVHDGGENPPSYSVTVSDGSLSTPTSPATIIFSNINDAPTVNLNQLTIDQNGKVTLTVNANLNSADPDNSQASLQYEASEVSGGHFENVSSPGVTITTFSHLQLQAGNVQFVHNGTTTAPSYVLTVNDGNLDSAPSTATISFSPTEGNEFFDDEAEAAENFASSEALENLGGKPPAETKTLDTPDDDNDVDDLSLNEQALALQEITEAIQDIRSEQSLSKFEIEDYALEETEDKRSSRSLTESIRELFGRQLLSGAVTDPLISQIDMALDVMASVIESSNFKNGLDSLRNDMANESLADKIQIGSSVAVSTGLSIGYVVWLIRGGVLVSSMLSALPAWRFIDPLPILAFGGTDDDEDKESLESLVESDTGDKHNANQPPANQTSIENEDRSS